MSVFNTLVFQHSSEPTSLCISMTKAVLPLDCSTETRPMERIHLTPTTLRRTCGGHHRHLHGKRNQDRLVENSMLNGGKLPHGIALDLTYLI